MTVTKISLAITVAVVALLAGATLYPATPDDAGGLRPLPARSAIGQRPAGGAAAADEGRNYLQLARDEADPSYLPRAEAALRESLSVQPEDNLPAFVGMAALANARHDFRGSLQWSQRAIAVSAYNAAAHGLLGDALFELGRERAAAAAYQRMVDLRPDTASYARASYTQQHAGNTRAAIGSMKLALEAAGPVGEEAAFLRHQLGDLYAGQGRHAAAERQNRLGSKIAPGFAPPMVGVAEAMIATGRIDQAVPLVERAVAASPTLEYLGLLGDLYSATGRTADAEVMYRRGARLLAEYRRIGVKPDADLIVYYADHGLRLDAAVREAFAVHRDRPTAKAADALAWVLHQSSRSGEARRYARESVRSPAAGAAEYFHAAQIEYAAGDQRAAVRHLRTALRLDPAFSVVDAPVARRQLKEWQ